MSANNSKQSTLNKVVSRCKEEKKPVPGQPQQQPNLNPAAGSKQCTVCNLEFATVQLCLAHELTHVIKATANDSVAKGNPKRRRTKSKPSFKPAKESTEDKEFRETVISALNSSENNSELMVLSQLFQPDLEHLQFVYERILHDLQTVLNSNNLYKFAIYPFGSIITSISLKTSDMDFYIEPIESPEMQLPSRKKILKHVKNFLFASKTFSNIIAIPSARVPIIKCVHVKTGFSLDMNLSSRMGVYNSRFLADLIKSDYRIHPLMLVLKIWGRQHELIRTGRMSNYCLMLLIVFYLQNTTPAILPPFANIIDNVHPMIIDGVNFALDENKLKPQNNFQNIRKLLEGFFQFYDSFDFSSNIIVTFLGKAINRKNFINGKVVFPEYDQQLDEFKSQSNSLKSRSDFTAQSLDCTTQMVLQDPFVLNHNTSRSIGLNVFAEFKKLIKIGRMFSDDTSIKATTLLINIFYSTPTVELNKAILNNTQAVPPSKTNDTPNVDSTKTTSNLNKTTNNVCKLNPIESELIYVRSYLRRNYPNQLFPTKSVNQFWIEKVIEFIKEILTDIYQLQVTNKSNDGEIMVKCAKIVGQLDAHSNKYQLHCELKSNLDLWTARPFVAKNNISALIHEQLEQAKQFKKERKDANKFAINFQASLHIKPSPTFGDIEIIFTNLGDEKSGARPLKEFFHIFTSRIRPFFKAYFDRMLKAENNVQSN